MTPDQKEFWCRHHDLLRFIEPFLEAAHETEMSADHRRALSWCEKELCDLLNHPRCHEFMENAHYYVIE